MGNAAQIENDQPTILFPEGYHARRESETLFKGYLGGVVVQSPEGLRYKVFFVDPTRLKQDLDDDAEAGRPYFTEPGLVVLPEVTTESIRTAVGGLWREASRTSSPSMMRSPTPST